MTSTTSPSEPFGTTPLPTVSGDGAPVHVSVDTSTLFHATTQQPQTHQLAVFDASLPSSDAGSLVAVNPHFIVYAVKNGLIRVLHRHSTLRSLLRHHKNQTVTDIQFFQDGDILATAGHDQVSSSIFVWRVYEKASEVTSDVLLEIQTNTHILTRVVWHPFNPNQFWMLQAPRQQTGQEQPLLRLASLVESTRLDTSPQEPLGHAHCRMPDDGVVLAGAIQLASHNRSANVTDLAWSSQQTKNVLTVFDNGDICLWDLKQLNNSQTTEGRAVTPICLGMVQDDGPISQCLFLPHDNALSQAAVQGDFWTPCFVTGTYQNKTITLWSAFGPSVLPTKLQVVSLEHPSPSYLLSACFGPAPSTASPPSCFLVLADRAQGQVMALHCKSEWNEQQGKAKRALLVGCDYIVPFQTLYPTYSWNVEAVPSTDISEEDLSDQGSLVFDMKLIAYQSNAVQALTLTSYMCLPPEHSWTESTQGVRIQRLLASAQVSDVGSSNDDDDLQFDETYDVDDDDAINNATDDDEFDAPHPSALPPPPAGFSDAQPTPALVINPFANWLGAIASNSTAPPPPMPANPVSSTPPAAIAAREPVAPVPSPPPATTPTFLSPMDILKGAAFQQPVPVAEELSSGHKSREMTPTASNSKGRKKQEPAQPQILKRDAQPPAPAAPATPVAAPALIQAPKEEGMVVVSSHSDESLSEAVRQAIRDEVQATMMPQLQEMLDKTLKNAVVNDLRAAIGRVKVDTPSVSAAISQNLEPSMQTAFADSIRTIMIPTLESVTNQVLAKVSGHLEKSEAATAATERDLDAITKQLGAMTQLVVKLTEEVHSLRETVTKQQQRPSVSSPQETAPSTPTAGSAEKLKNDILAMLGAKKYNEAFTAAVSSTASDITYFCCVNADINDVFGGATPALTQMILICLMQQLATMIVSPNPNWSTQLELEWLQEIALCLNPADPLIVKHVPPVLQLLVSGINTRMAQNDPALRRPLQRLLQVIRGMQMT